jgi:hypothetical protein
VFLGLLLITILGLFRQPFLQVNRPGGTYRLLRRGQGRTRTDLFIFRKQSPERLDKIVRSRRLSLRFVHDVL